MGQGDGALIQAPTLPSPTNYVDIDPDRQDIYGIPQLRFHFQWGQNELLMWQHSKQVMVELFKDVKAIFRDNPVEAFTKGTGGSFRVEPGDTITVGESIF